MQKQILQTWFFRQQPAEVWEYLTRPELIEQWLMKTDFKPVLGYKFQFTFNPKPGSTYEGHVDCEVLEVVPFKRLSYSWNGSAKEKNRNFHSTVVWTLTPKDGGTELHLSHSGFELEEDILSHSSGWSACLKRFDEHINAGMK